LPTVIYTILEASFVKAAEESLIEKKIPYMVGRCRYSVIPRGDIIGDQVGCLKLLFHRDDMRLLGVHVTGEQATEVVHLGLLAMMMNALQTSSIKLASTIQRSATSTNTSLTRRFSIDDRAS